MRLLARLPLRMASKDAEEMNDYLFSLMRKLYKLNILPSHHTKSKVARRRAKRTASVLV